MYIKVTLQNFVDAFKSAGRDPFSKEAYEALLTYYEELEASTGEGIELDPIGICCDWTEMTLEEVEDEAESLANLEEMTLVITLANGKYLVQSY